MLKVNCNVKFTPQHLNPYIEDAQQHHPELALHLNAAQEASLNGVHRVHLISYAYDGALFEELFTRDGSGTMVE